ncbi:hypothetical protein [Streptomyces sp. KAU_LT]|uniref:hypothetical protein n=1 Tax=Streptomyces sp. KAU_LT TaxID=3046669 RepID=UPI0024B65A39|nr:hypothetical protein [Streptomyces sp. KAU_LT]MDI9836230.1 hypothetical protein [Streptomyces sp. KAU_LT]
MHELAFALMVAGLACVGASFLCTARDRPHGYAWVVAGLLLHLVGAVAEGLRFLAAADAAVLALSLWSWWNNGGGDGTRRRLRQWARRFQGVRRTAPASAT